MCSRVRFGVPEVFIDGISICHTGQINFSWDKKWTKIQVLHNDLKDYVNSIAGNYVQYTPGSDCIKEASMALTTAQALIVGEHAVKIVFDDDVLLDLPKANVSVDQVDLTERWSMTAVTPITLIIEENNG